MEKFKAIGISFRNTPLEIREKVAFSESESKDFMLKLKEIFGLNEGLVVSTCNRTEVYYSSSDDISNELISMLSAQKTRSTGNLKDYFKRYTTEEAINHLFHVSLGLDSQVLGDIQISNQVKRAYQVSVDLEMAGPFLHRLMHTVFYAKKRVVQETRLQDGNASVASVAAELVKGFVEHIDSPRIVLVGSGEIGQNVLENLKTLEVSIKLINRTKSKAEKLSGTPNIAVAELAQLKEVMAESDVVISAVSGNEVTIDAAHLDMNDIHHKLLIDLSVPRSISEDVGSLLGVALYNVDQLTEKTQKSHQIRQQSIPEAKEIIKSSMNGFNEWKSEMEVSPTINKLKKVLDQIRQEELIRHTSKVSEKEMELLEVVTKNMVQKVIKLPVLQLKSACKRGESETLVGVLNNLFNLEAKTTQKGK